MLHFTGSTTLSPQKEAEDVKQALPEVINDKEKEENETEELNWDKNNGRERRRTYSSESGSSSSTELCDDDAAHLSDLDSSGEGASPVSMNVSVEDNDRVFSPPKSPTSKGKPFSINESLESKNIWETIGIEDTTSKEGRLSSSTMTPGVEETPFSPQDTTDFKLPELYLPSLSPSVSTHLTPPDTPLKDSSVQEKSPKSSLDNLLIETSQQLTPASSTTTSSASEQSPSTTSSPGPMASTTSSPPSSPQASSSLPLGKTASGESNKDTVFHGPLEKPDTLKTLPEDASPEIKIDELSWMETCVEKTGGNGQSPQGVESLLMKWPHLDTKKWESSVNTSMSEADDKHLNSHSLQQSMNILSPDVSSSQPLTQSIFTLTYSTLLPSTSVNIPIIPSPSPQPIAIPETSQFLTSPSTPPPLETLSTTPSAITPSSTVLNLTLQPSPPLYTPSSTPSPLLPSSTSTQPLFTMPSIPPLFHMSSSPLPQFPPLTTPPSYIPLLSTQPSVFTSSSITQPYSSLSLMTTDAITTTSLSPLSFQTTSVPYTTSPSSPLSFHPATTTTAPQLLMPLSPQPFYHITTTSVSSNVSPPSPISFHLAMSTTVPSTTSPSTPLSFHPTTKSILPSMTSPSSPISFHPTMTTVVQSTMSPVCPLTFYPTSSTSQPYITSSSSPPPFHSSLSSTTPMTTSSTTSPNFYSSLSTPPPLTTSLSTTPLYQPSLTSISSLIPSSSLPPHPAPSQDAASALELTSHKSSPSSITTKSVPSSSMLPKMSTSIQSQRTFPLPPLPLHPTLPLTCDTDSTSEEKQKNPASLPINWDWLPGESNILKKPKSGSSPSSLLSSPIGASTRTITEGNLPSSPPKNSQNHTPRRHSERALRIIQENSEILQRMLRHPPPPSPPSPMVPFPMLPSERLHPLEGAADSHQGLEGGDRSPHSPASPASSSWALDTSTDVSASASSKSPATSPVALGDVISWGVRRGTFAMPPGGTLPSPPSVTSPPQSFNPFPQRASWRQPKELGVKLGLYSSASSPSPPVAHPRSSPSTPTSPSKSSSAYLKQTFK